MKLPVALIVVLVAILAAACRQPDGQIPMPAGDTVNRISDLGHDFQAVARGDSEAKKEFVDDFWGLADEGTAQRQPVLDFAGRFAEAVVSAPLTEAAAEQLAHTSWTLVGVTDLSEKQIRALQEELRSQLLSAGIAQDRVDAIVAELPAVQRAVTTRPRRWYEVL